MNKYNLKPISTMIQGLVNTLWKNLILLPY